MPKRLQRVERRNPQPRQSYSHPLAVTVAGLKLAAIKARASTEADAPT
jgi:hypothetical protein